MKEDGVPGFVLRFGQTFEELDEVRDLLELGNIAMILFLHFEFAPGTHFFLCKLKDLSFRSLLPLDLIKF